MAPCTVPGPLTQRQRLVFHELCRFFAHEGRHPTLRELATALGVHSSSTAYTHVCALQRKGLLRHTRYVALTPAGLEALLTALPALLEGRPPHAR